jgi:hypothetical protein
MPYTKITHKDGTCSVKNTETGDVKASHTTCANATKQLRLLRGVEHGWKPTGGKSVKGAQHGATIRTTREVMGMSPSGPAKARGRIAKPAGRTFKPRTTSQVAGLAGGGTVAERRAARKGYKQAVATSEPGEGKRFKALKASAKAGGARNPGAVAASAGRKKYGNEKFQQMAARGRSRAARSK